MTLKIVGDQSLYLRLIQGLLFQTGYGFVDFESPAVAQKAVTALKSKGIQAQMAKVFRALCPLTFLFL